MPSWDSFLCTHVIIALVIPVSDYILHAFVTLINVIVTVVTVIKADSRVILQFSRPRVVSCWSRIYYKPDEHFLSSN